MAERDSLSAIATNSLLSRSALHSPEEGKVDRESRECLELEIVKLMIDVSQKD